MGERMKLDLPPIQYHKVEVPKYREPPVEPLMYFVDHDGYLKRCFSEPHMIVKEWRARV